MCLRTHRERQVGFRHSRSLHRECQHTRIRRCRLAVADAAGIGFSHALVDVVINAIAVLVGPACASAPRASVGFRHSRSSLRSGSHIRIERPRLARADAAFIKVEHVPLSTVASTM